MRTGQHCGTVPCCFFRRNFVCSNNFLVMYLGKWIPSLKNIEIFVRLDLIKTALPAFDNGRVFRCANSIVIFLFHPWFGQNISWFLFFINIWILQVCTFIVVEIFKGHMICSIWQTNSGLSKLDFRFVEADQNLNLTINFKIKG